MKSLNNNELFALLYLSLSLEQHENSNTNSKSVNASSTSHNKTGLAENHQQPLIGDNNLEKLSKTGSFLSHLAREFSGGRASTSSRSNSGSIIASGLTAMKATSSRNNSCGSDNSGGASGSGIGSGSRATTAADKRVMRKHQPSVSESSVCEEAREIDDPIPSKPMDSTLSSMACNPNEQSNENEPKTVSEICPRKLCAIHLNFFPILFFDLQLKQDVTVESTDLALDNSGDINVTLSSINSCVVSPSITMTDDNRALENSIVMADQQEQNNEVNEIADQAEEATMSTATATAATAAAAASSHDETNTSSNSCIKSNNDDSSNNSSRSSTRKAEGSDATNVTQITITGN